VNGLLGATLTIDRTLSFERRSVNAIMQDVF